MKKLCAVFLSLCAAASLALPALADVAADPIAPVEKASLVWPWIAVGAALILAVAVIAASIRRKGSKK